MTKPLERASGILMLNLTTAIARFIRIALFLPMLLPCCKGQDGEADFWRHERELVELAQQLKLGEYRLGLTDSGEKKTLDDLKILLSENDARLRNLQSEKSALLAEIKKLETRNMELGRTALEQKRSSARGMKFETLAARDGRTFKNATISMVTDSGVAFRHEHGAARLRYAELSDEQRLFFGMEEAAALVAEDQERREALAYGRDMDLELAAIREHEEKISALDETAKASRQSASLLAASARQPEISELAQPAKPFGSGSIYRRYYNSSGYRSYQPVYRYVYRHPSAPNPFCPTSRNYSQRSGRVCPSVPTTP